MFCQILAQLTGMKLRKPFFVLLLLFVSLIFSETHVSAQKILGSRIMVQGSQLFKCQQRVQHKG